jgi:hypothetical protein
LNTGGYSSPDIDRARSASRLLRRIFDPGGTALGTLEEAQRLCEIGGFAIDDLYCRNVMRAVSACAEHLFCAGAEEVSLRPLIQTLLAAFDGRVDGLEHPDSRADAYAGRHLDRRRAQRRDYILRPTAAARRVLDHRTP